MAEARRTLETEIRQLDMAFEQGVAAKDATAVANAYYTEDAVLLPPNHPVVEGRDNIATFLKGLMDQGGSAVKLEAIRIDSEGALAYVQGKYTLTIDLPDGNTTTDIGKYVVTYRRQDNGSWKVVTDIFNSDNPAPPNS